MKEYNAEIIAVGTELLLGQITNTNAEWLSNELASSGINVFYHTVVGDNLSRVQDAFDTAQKRANIIIVTGGLGPTDDDMTREAFTNMTGLELFYHEPTLEKIQAYFKDQNRVMTPNNRKQARVFETAHILENKAGMAPGMIVNHDKKIWIFLPGVPREMKHLFTKQVLPFLYKKTKQEYVIKSMNLRFIGIGEAQLEHDLREIIASQENPTIAPLAQDDGIVIRLTVKDQSIESADHKLAQTKELILNKTGDYCYGINEETIERKITQLLNEQNLTIAAAESLTGGMFTSRIISVEGASEICPGSIISYDSNIKKNVLGVSESTISHKGVVSEQCATEMAINVKSILETDLGISFTGVAGPTDLEGKEVGTVFIALATPDDKFEVKKYVFHGSRSKIRHQATLKGFEILYRYLKL